MNELIATGQYGRLFAVVHFASRQWKITSEDLILIENHIPAECGDRIRMEKVGFVLAIFFSPYANPKDYFAMNVSLSQCNTLPPSHRVISYLLAYPAGVHVL